MNQKKKIGISILIFSTILVRSQITIDSCIQETFNDSNVYYYHTDAMNDIWKVSYQSIVRKSENVSYNDSFTSDFITSDLIIDSKFPLKNLFFNASKNQIKIINSRWGVLSEINLNTLQIYQPTLANYNSDGTIWILDKNSNHLLKINENGTIKTDIINSFKINSTYFFPSRMTDFKYYFIANDTSYGLFIIDNYGTLLSQYQKEENEKIFIIGEEKYLVSNNNIYLLDIDSQKRITKSKKYFIFSKGIRKMNRYKNSIAIIGNDGQCYIVKQFHELLFNK